MKKVYLVTDNKGAKKERVISYSKEEVLSFCDTHRDYFEGFDGIVISEIQAEIKLELNEDKRVEMSAVKIGSEEFGAYTTFSYCIDPAIQRGLREGIKVSVVDNTFDKEIALGTVASICKVVLSQGEVETPVYYLEGVEMGFFREQLKLIEEGEEV